MIDIDIARRLQDAGLRWEPADGDIFTIDNEQLREEAFMLSSMVIEQGVGRSGTRMFRFNGTTEWALDSVEQHEALWVPREDQLRRALGEAFVSLRRLDELYVVSFVAAPGSAAHEGTHREVRAPSAEDAYAAALLVHLTGE